MQEHMVCGRKNRHDRRHLKVPWRIVTGQKPVVFFSFLNKPNHTWLHLDIYSIAYTPYCRENTYMTRHGAGGIFIYLFTRVCRIFP